MQAKGSLQRRIIILVSGGVLTVLIFLGILSYITVSQSVRRTLQERMNLAEATGQHLDYVIKQNLDLLQSVAFADGVDIQDIDLAPEQRALRNVYFHSFFADGVYILDTRGQMLWREPFFPEQPINLSKYPHIKEAFETGKPIVSDIYIIEGTGRPVVSMVIPIKNGQGDIVGLVGGDIDITSTSLQKVIQPIGLGPSGYVDVVDSKGVVIAASIQSHVLRESDHSNRLADLIQNKRPTVGTCHECHESTERQRVQQTRNAEVMAFVPLQAAPWGLIIREGENEALAPAHSIQKQFILLGLPIFVISLLLAWGIAQSVIKPVTALTKTAAKIASGDLSAETPYLGGDEIGRLALTFEAMRLKLKASIESFQSLNRDLESRVEQRTTELRESEQQLKRTNSDLALLNAELLHKEQIRSELLHKVISAQEEERKRIARELHDETSQSLAALVVALEALALAPFRGKTDVRKRVEGVKSLAVLTLEEIHKLIFDLRPSLLDDLGLIPAINWYAEMRLQSEGVKVHIEASGDERRLEPQTETVLFRVVQEAITNIAKHANAENVVISFEFDDTSVVVEIEDDGDGFDVGKTSDAPKLEGGYGLLGMGERISLLEGELSIESEPDGGTRIKIMVPISQRSNQYAENTSVVGR